MGHTSAWCFLCGRWLNSVNWARHWMGDKYAKASCPTYEGYFENGLARVAASVFFDSTDDGLPMLFWIELWGELPGVHDAQSYIALRAHTVRYIGYTSDEEKRKTHRYNIDDGEERRTILCGADNVVAKAFEAYAISLFDVSLPANTRLIRNGQQEPANMLLPDWLEDLIDAGHATRAEAYDFMRWSAARVLKRAVLKEIEGLSLRDWWTPAWQAAHEASLSTPICAGSKRPRLTYAARDEGASFEYMIDKYREEGAARGAYDAGDIRALFVNKEGAVERLDDEEAAAAAKAIGEVRRRKREDAGPDS